MTAVLRDIPPPNRAEHAKDDWVQSLTSASASNASHRDLQVNLKTKSTSGDGKAETSPELDIEDDSFFERKETPPRLSKTRAADRDTAHRGDKPHPTQAATNGDDSETETEDEDCLDIPPTTSQRQAVSTIEPPGTFEEDHVITTRSRTPATSNLVGGAEPKSEPRDTEPEEDPKPQPVRTKPGLGKFGGKRAQPSAPTPEPTSSAPSPSKPKGALGRFGGKAKKETADQEKKDDVNASAKAIAASSCKLTPEVEKVPERELTEEELLQQKQAQADKKREKLKRELEAKAKGPLKKKRKF